MIRISLLTILSLICNQLPAQQTNSNSGVLRQGYVERDSLSLTSLLKEYPVRNIGPVVQGGRVSDLAVNLNNTKEFYVGYASGGIFKTTNNGISFEPIFDHQGALGIGDMALAPSDENMLYVGTGEKNSSRSSYAGTGMYKTIDKGVTWEFIGLEHSQHISRVIVHPQDPDILWVAVLGALYSNNPERGVYKSIDGGKNWEKTLFVNDSTGIADLVINPQEPDQLWAASWERTRQAWNFKGEGPGSGIYRSEDGGNTWVLANMGFVEGVKVGRIGLDISASNPNILYALLDNQAKIPKDEELEVKLRIADFLDMSEAQLLALDTAEFNEFLKDQGYPKKYNALKVKAEVKEGKYQPSALAHYFGDANQALFDTQVAGAELYRSEDSGQSWDKIDSYEGVYFTYGYYFGEVRVAPDNPDLVYIFGVPLLKTLDGGKTFHRLDTIGNVHVDHQTLWIDPNDGDHLLLGNDGGLYQSYDQGANWLHINNMSVGQFYTVNVDMEKPYNVYGGLQDNGVLRGSSQSTPNRTKHWEKIFGGDGMFVAADPRNSDLIYTGFQFGNYFRLDRRKNKSEKITPQHDLGDTTLRFNWRTPVIMSQHNSDILYFGAQKLFRSLDKGTTWEAISTDLTMDLPQGNVPYSTISCLAESALKFGLVYVGTDDGQVQVLHQGNWKNTSSNLPGKWVSSIYPSTHEEGVVYLAMNGYREDDFGTYIYKSEDYGTHWQSLKGNLPEVVVNVLIEDPVNQQLLYLGTDHGAYVSFSSGERWELIAHIPNVACYDMIVHPRDHELVVGTHGRSIYVMDIKPLQKLKDPEVSLLTFEGGSTKHKKDWGKSRYPYLEPNEPEVTWMYYLGQPGGKVTVKIQDSSGTLLRTLNATGDKGFHQLKWDLKEEVIKKREVVDSKYVGPGTYTVTFTNGVTSEEIKLEVKEE